MKSKVYTQKGEFLVDFSNPLDISIPLIPGKESPNCFWAPTFVAEPVVSGDWIGDTTKGGIVNFKNLKINPHGNGTHTECVGHISKEFASINETLNTFHFLSRVYSVYPKKLDNGDLIITLEHVKEIDLEDIEALIIRTLPNRNDKLNRMYSGTNPTYIHHEAIAYIIDQGVAHLLVDLPSVDREEDEGKLLAHHTFWNYPATLDTTKTITELIFVKELIKDDIYLLNLQIGSFHLDVSPSKPILYEVQRV